MCRNRQDSSCSSHLVYQGIEILIAIQILIATKKLVKSSNIVACNILLDVVNLEPRVTRGK